MESASLILAVNKKFDLSEQLIAYLNQPQDKLTVKPKILIEPSRIGIIDPRLFIDIQRGIKGLKLPESGRFEDACEPRKQCDDVGEYLQEYAVKNGFSIIFDARRL